MAFQKEQSHTKEVVKFSAVTRSPASGKGPKKYQAEIKICRISVTYLPVVS